MIDGHRGQQAEGEQPETPAPDRPSGVAELRADAPAAPAETAADARVGFWRRIQLGKRLVRHGVTANQVTLFGVVLAAVTGLTIGRGWFWAAMALLTTGGLMDTLDGAVAKAAGTASKKGAFLDSVADRVADGLIFGGVAWYLASSGDPRMALLPFAIFGVSTVISYERAKAESLGYDARGGLMERAERLIFLGVTLLFGVLLPATFVPLLAVLLALSCFTALQRFFKVWRQATPELAATARPAWRRGRVESRWQAWREPRADGVRRRAPSTTRLRARRRDETLGVRLRRVIVTERSSAGTSRSWAERRNLARSAWRRRTEIDS